MTRQGARVRIGKCLSRDADGRAAVAEVGDQLGARRRGKAAVLLNDLGEVETRLAVGPAQRFLERPDPSRRLRLVRRFVRTRLAAATGERIFLPFEVVDPQLQSGKLLRGGLDVED